MKIQITEHRLQSTDYRTRKNSRGSGLWSLGSKSGFTLTELLLALVITALATAAVYTSFIVQQRSFVSQDQLAETQVSSKIAFDMIANDVRNAGFGYPAAENPSINGSTGAVTISDAAGPNNSDTITLLAGFKSIATLYGADAVIGGTTISISYTGTTYFNLTDRRYLSLDGLDFAQINNCTLQDGNCSSLYALTLDRGINKPFPIGRFIYLVESVTYQISGSDLQRVSTSRGTEIVANNIEDFQVAAVDQDGDGKTDRLRVSLLARTANEDQTLEPSTKPYYSTGIVIEGNTTLDTDKFRRRVWTMELSLRNPI
ncbi:MAG: prepilin-type N-terminal cleavage/methylation domain-containing protein [Nitrospirae bacterium]|nr:prepilin-type N-terminal cleavage/methylation domain-containing protein [Nitrospirota bacterium]